MVEIKELGILNFILFEIITELRKMIVYATSFKNPIDGMATKYSHFHFILLSISQLVCFVYFFE